MPDPAIEPENKAPAVAPTTVWQNPDSSKPVAERGNLYKFGLIAGGVLVFFGLAVVLAFI